MGRSNEVLPRLNTFDEYSHNFEDGDYIYPRDESMACPQPSCPDITEEEWAQIVCAMSPEEWAIFFAINGIPEQARNDFSLSDSAWPSLCEEKKSQVIECGLQPEQSSVVTEGYVAIEEESSYVTDGFVAISDEASQHTWTFLSEQNDAESVISWSTFPLTFREVLLKNSDPIKPWGEPPDLKYRDGKTRFRTVKETNDSEEDCNTSLFDLRESLKNLRGGKPRYKGTYP